MEKPTVKTGIMDDDIIQNKTTFIVSLDKLSVKFKVENTLLGNYGYIYQMINKSIEQIKQKEK
jgi:hypothetical protein